MKDIIDTLKRSLDFKGRSTRNQFWNYFSLQFFTIVVGGYFFQKGSFGDSLVQAILIIMFIPYISVGIRRMHDTNKSGWYFFIPLYNIFLLTKAGDKGVNRFDNNK